jgi:hypothetical protein
MEAEMRNFAVLSCALACVTTSAFAQTSLSPTGGVPNPITGVPNPVTPFGVTPSTRPAPQSGGYTTYGPNGAITRVTRNNDGGYTTYGPNGAITRVTRNYDGGYTVYSPNGITRLTPNSNGGYTLYGNGYGVPCFIPGYGWYPCPRGYDY